MTDLPQATGLDSWVEGGHYTVGGSDDEADLASFHLPQISPSELKVLQVFPASPLPLLDL